MGDVTSFALVEAGQGADTIVLINSGSNSAFDRGITNMRMIAKNDGSYSDSLGVGNIDTYKIADLSEAQFQFNIRSNLASPAISIADASNMLVKATFTGWAGVDNSQQKFTVTVFDDKGTVSTADDLKLFEFNVEAGSSLQKEDFQFLTSTYTLDTTTFDFVIG
jgi:hypothetical protein